MTLRRPRSLRSTLLLGTVGALVLVFLAAGVALDRGVRWSVIQQIDRELHGKAVLLASTVEVTRTGLDIAFSDLDMREFERSDDPLLLGLSLMDRTPLYRSPGSRGLRLEPRSTEGRLEVVTLERDGRRLRAVELSFRPSVDLSDDDDRPLSAADSLAFLSEIGVPTVYLFLARDTASIDRWLQRVRLAMVLVGGGATLLALILLGTVIRSSLRPLDRLADRISQLDESRLSVRVPVHDAPVEVAPVVERLNGLLHQLETAFERERTFSADIAHELRTPLAGLRTTLEVELARERTAEEYRASLGEVLLIVGQLQRMVHTLLELAQLESGIVPIHEEPIEVRERLQDIWKTLDAIAITRGLTVHWSIDPALVVTTDAGLFESALRNVLENAVVHGDERGHLHLSAVTGTGGLTLRVANSGSTVSQEQVPGLLDRFSRSDPSRSAGDGHFGLGLAIVHRICQVLGVMLEVRSSVGGDFIVELTFRPVVGDTTGGLAAE